MGVILGLNAFHADSAACIVVDGQLVAAAEEERFRRIKHWAGFPTLAIEYCLAEAGISLSQVDHIAMNQDSNANLKKKLSFTLAKRPDVGLIIDRIRNKRERDGVKVHLKRAFPGEYFKGKVHAVEHHLAHLSSAFHVSPYKEAVVVSVDGFGDFASAQWGVGRGSSISVEDKVHFPHSLGLFYQALTQFIGFPNYGDEYKVMGLAPYGKPIFLEQMREIVLLQEDGSYELNLEYFRHHRESITQDWDGGVPSFSQIYSERLTGLLGPVRGSTEKLEQRHFDIAHSIQAMYEEAFFHLLNTLYAKYGIENLALSGGCAMNSVANGKIARSTEFKNVYIQSAAGDAGGAIGAALSTWHDISPDASRQFSMNHAYWGPSYSNDEVSSVLESCQTDLDAASITVKFIGEEAELARVTAQAISEGKVIGWFHGRMEWGPRALGNRSILGDPRRADIKDILNLKIKRRESFRPFAPSVLREEVKYWFEEDDDVPFMMKVFQVLEARRSEVPAVTHVDGSGRLQTVTERDNGRYYRLIKAFYDLTGVPMILNTSFNENEPIVCTPEQALSCFQRTEMDVLVLENFVLCRT